MQRSRKVLTLTLVLALVFCALTAIPANAVPIPDTIHNETQNVWYTDLSAAVSAAVEDDVLILKAGEKFELDAALTINKAITLKGADDGEKPVIKPSAAFTENTVISKNNLITIAHSSASKTLLSNLAVQDSLRNGIHVYNTKNVEIKDVTITNSFGAAIVVNGSEVTVSNITTSENGWGGINVDNPNALLTIAGTLNIAEEVKVWTELDVSDAPNSNNPIKDETNSWTFTKDDSDNIVYSPKKYTVTFDSNKGSDVPAATVEHGSLLTLPATPGKANYAFVGWYSDEALTKPFDFTIAVSADITLYAKWAVNWKNPFNDVKYGQWYYDDIQFVHMNAIVNGMSKTTFAPNLKTDRAMAITVLYRAAGSPAASGTFTFKDVPAGSYYEDAVKWAVENKITDGYSATQFAPRDLVTREQLATMLYRFEKIGTKTPAVVSPDKTFKDGASVSDYAKEAVKALTTQGIINGMNDETFAPRGAATRAQVAAMVHRYLDAVK